MTKPKIWEKLSPAIAARREMTIDLIREMVQRPSYETEAAVQEYIAGFWQQRGIEPDIWEIDDAALRAHPAAIDGGYDYRGRKNLVVTFKGSSGGRSLVLNGHMDVVPVDPSGVWTGDPWSGEYRDGRVYGRGAVDMKGGLAIAMTVMDALLECKVRLRGDLQLHCVVDEENGGNGTLAAALRGYRGDATIFLEPTTPELLVVSGRGAQFFRITVIGAEGGIEYQAILPNAIEKAYQVLVAVQAFAARRMAQVNDPLYRLDATKLPCGICKIQAGNWPSTLPASCVMEGSIECMPGEDIRQVSQDFKRYLLEATQQDEWLRQHPPEIEFFGLRLEAAKTDVEAPLVKSLLEAARQITGKRPEVVGGGGSDLRIPVLYADSPSVLFGPSGGAIHSTDEYIEVDSAMQVAQILGNFILGWCQAVED